MKKSLIILLFFISGVVMGLFHFIPDIMVNNDFSKYALYALMFLVGISVGSDKSSWKALAQYKLKIFLVPLCVIIGSLLGAALISVFYPALN